MAACPAVPWQMSVPDSQEVLFSADAVTRLAALVEREAEQLRRALTGFHGDRC
ncbi:hypothetical protein [Streptomyces sp. NPDC002187]|uniref:hypothetical protein n=1 Tax=Streptomyces sp. NPDC002187 TaxID=3364637 RepID=UPI0036A4167B